MDKFNDVFIGSFYKKKKEPHSKVISKHNFQEYSI